MNWTIEQLRAFVAAADEGSFSAAGRLLGRAQSVVSTHVSVLEDTLGVELFDRSGCGSRQGVLDGGNHATFTCTGRNKRLDDVAESEERNVATESLVTGLRQTMGFVKDE